jgi:hypothetical protein
MYLYVEPYKRYETIFRKEKISKESQTFKTISAKKEKYRWPKE